MRARVQISADAGWAFVAEWPFPSHRYFVSLRTVLDPVSSRIENGIDTSPNPSDEDFRTAFKGSLVTRRGRWRAPAARVSPVRRAR
jgi:hypothetical protein